MQTRLRIGSIAAKLRLSTTRGQLMFMMAYWRGPMTLMQLQLLLLLFGVSVQMRRMIIQDRYGGVH